MNKIIDIQNLSLSLNGVEILKDLNFSICLGEYISIIGPNGSGKSSLIKVILGLIPSGLQGNVCFKNISIVDIGYLPQANSFRNRNFPCKVWEIVGAGLLGEKRFPKFLNKSDYEKIDKILKKLNIFDLKNKNICDLSGGQQQKVLLSRAMVSTPKVLFLDEPISALDPNTRLDFYNLLHQLNKKEKITIIFISHDLEGVKKFSDKILYLDKKIIYFGPTKKYLEEKDV